MKLVLLMVKTLGIKFEVAGVKEAQAGLNSLKNSLNQSLQQNKQAADKSLKQVSFRNSIKGRRQEVTKEASNEAISKTRNARFSDSVDASTLPPAQIVPTTTAIENQKITDAVAQGTKQGIADLAEQNEQIIQSKAKTFENFKNSSQYEQINTGFYGGIGQEAGRQVFVNLQNLVGKFLGLGEQRETINISDKSITRLAATISATVKANKFLPSNIQISIPKLVESKQTKQAQGGGLINSLLSPISTVKFGFFEGIGASFGHQ